MHRVSKLFLLFSLLLAAPLFAARSPFLGAPVNLPGTVQAENYDNGGEGVAYHDTSPGNAFGPVYRTEDVDIGQITAGGYHIGALANGEWTEYTVNVGTTGPYNVTIRYSSATTLTTNFRLLLNGVDVSGSIPITSSGDWQNYVTKVVTVNLTAGSSKILRVSFDVGAFNLDSLAFAAGCVAPAITTQPLNKTPTTGQTITLTGAASGTAPLSYQWLKNGAAIPGATSTSLTLAGVEQWKDGGNYQLRASNSCGTATSNIAVVRVTCNADGPDEGTENINRALRGLGDLCDWSADVNTSFPYNFGNGQSYNLPVLTAATAFIKEPVRPGVWNMNTWWTDYLSGELGDRGTVWYYGGQELGSYNYQAYNEAAILAVHYQANLVGNTTVRDLARRWLRATVALHALAASPGPVQSLHAKGQQVGGVAYNGPYVGFAGMRSSWGFWNTVDRSIIMSQALGRVTNRSGEFSSQKNIREWVEPRWTGPNGNVYGMTSTDQADLNAAINSATLPANFVTRFLGANLRTQVRYHVVAWSGVKVTLMETNTNGNTVPTYGVAYFAAPRLASGQEAHFLYPWQGLFMPADRRHRNGVTAGWGAIDVTSATYRYIQASNAPGSATHPLETVTIDNLPLSARSYWLVLSPSAAPALQ